MKSLLCLAVALSLAVMSAPSSAAEAPPPTLHALSNLSTSDALPALSDQELASIEGEGTFICIGCVNLTFLTQINTNVQIGVGRNIRQVSNQSNLAFITQRIGRFGR